MTKYTVKILDGLGTGIGCLFTLIGLGILLNFGRVLDIIQNWGKP